MPASPPTEKSVWDLRRAELLTSLARPPQAVFNRTGRLTALAATSRRLPDRLLPDSAQRLEQLARQVEADYEGKDLLLVGVLKGAALFLADLARAVQVDPSGDLAFARARSPRDQDRRMNGGGRLFKQALLVGGKKVDPFHDGLSSSLGVRGRQASDIPSFLGDI